MNEFKITDERINYICGQFGLTDPDSIRTVRNLHRDFLYFYECRVRGQYLSSIVIAMERYIQETYKKPQFRITISKMRESNARSGISFLKWTNDRYDIYIPTNNDDISIRNIVAHELGHLFYIINCTHTGISPKKITDDDRVDRMADILGIFTIAERTDFYVNKAPSVGRDSFNGIVTDFKKMGAGRQRTQKPLEGTMKYKDDPPK